MIQISPSNKIIASRLASGAAEDAWVAARYAAALYSLDSPAGAPVGAIKRLAMMGTTLSPFTNYPGSSLSKITEKVSIASGDVTVEVYSADDLPGTWRSSVGMDEVAGYYPVAMFIRVA